ncbi:MAG: coproporphyrinogen dehydrogenase HemZ [Wujia sp.]
MVYLIQNSQIYNNDIRAMIMAFYPGVKIVEKIEERAEDKAGLDFVFRIDYGCETTKLTILKGDEASAYKNVDGPYVLGSKELTGDYRDKDVFRNIFKMASYQLLCELTGKTLPWGDLTGVRPTKIAMAQLKRGATYEEAVTNYMETYAVSERKAILGTRVAERELELTKAFDLDHDYCLYFGIPFCPSRCLYCSFTSYPIAVYKDKAALYVEKLKEELSFIADIYKHKNLVAIYVGGGTPTSIDHILLDDLLSHVNKVFHIASNGSVTSGVATDRSSRIREFTVEAGRPDSITREKLEVMRKNGVTRISINPQTMNDETLSAIGRAHTSAQAEEAFRLARECGFDNINMDLIAGLPGENLDSMRYTLDRISKLKPESLTVHSLAIKRAANLRQQMSEFSDTINRDMDGMLNLVSDVAEKLSMEPYYLYRQKNIGGNLENVGYAVKGRECLYNVLIMEELTDIIAAGAGASTKLTFHSENRVERIENCKSVDDYIDRFDEMLERKRRGMDLA